MATNFQQRTLLRVTLVSVKKSRGIRISLNIMRSMTKCKKITMKWIFNKGFRNVRMNFRKWIPTVLLWSPVRNLEVRLVVLNVLIVFRMFNATDL